MLDIEYRDLVLGQNYSFILLQEGIFYLLLARIHNLFFNCIDLARRAERPIAPRLYLRVSNGDSILKQSIDPYKSWNVGAVDNKQNWLLCFGRYGRLVSTVYIYRNDCTSEKYCERIDAMIAKDDIRA